MMCLLMLLVDMGCRPLFYIVGSGLRVTTYLEFLETWKCPGIWLRSPKRPKGRGICVVREIWLWQLDKMLVTKLWC